ncbi:MAG: penicillin-insensitive murein endopeptidase [Rhodobacteraceae bacterium]|nr:MAG: penicillin-insensitive murein endopeptidase [Paracoccaceae bacterium]
MISLITKFLLNIFILLVFWDFYIEAAKAERFENVKAYELFKKEKLPSNQKLNSIGSYSNGCLAGGIELPESGNTWQAMRLSRNRNWGHKNTLNFVRELSLFASSLDGWKGLYIGDISQARGGPFETGHVSHQIGLDVDIWMLPAKTLDLSKNSRENLSSVSIKSLDSKNVNTNWSIQHAKILKKAAKNSLVDRIFVTAVAKISMCENEKGDKSWLKKIRPWYGHDTHFHVRLKCPENSIDCIKQIPTVNELSDDRYGCDETLNWWVTEFLGPKKPLTKKEKEALKSKRTPKDYTMADLPLKCGAVINSP